MDRYDSFDAMDRMFEQIRRTMLEGMDATGAMTDATGGRPMGLPTGETTDLASTDGARMIPFGLAGMDITDMRSLGMGAGSVRLETTDDGFVAVADLPGFERDELTLSIDDGVLRIGGVHEASEDDETTSRRHTRHVSETVRLPEDVDLEAVSATYRNGILEISLPTLESRVDDAHVIDIE